MRLATHRELHEGLVEFLQTVKFEDVLVTSENPECSDDLIEELLCMGLYPIRYSNGVSCNWGVWVFGHRQDYIMLSGPFISCNVMVSWAAFSATFNPKYVISHNPLTGTFTITHERKDTFQAANLL